MDTTTLDRFYEYADGKESDQTTGMVSRYWYDSANYDSAYFKYSYAYDALGNITSYSQHGTTYTYNYDDQNQLISQSGGGKTYTYTYDNAGNILTASNGTTINSYTYGNALWKDQLTAFNGQTITYDASGNPLSYYNGKRYTFTWEEGRNLVRAAEGTDTYTYAYDSSGLRISKTANGVKHEYLYASGKLLRETVSENGVVTAVLDFVYDHNGHPFALNYTVDGTTTRYYYITNLQGDVLAMITGQGVVVASYSYDPYGKVISATKEMADINPLRYRGYYYDAETGFYYLQSRYYDTSICRFINADKYMVSGQGIIRCNMFAYCLNNPVNCYDSNGEDAIWIQEGDSASGFGHSGLLIQDEEGNWYFFYFGANFEASLGGIILGTEPFVVFTQIDATGLDMRKEADIIEALKQADSYFPDSKNDPRSAKVTSTYYLDGDYTASFKHLQELANSADSQVYMLFTNNCAQNVWAALSKSNYFFSIVDCPVVPDSAYQKMRYYMGLSAREKIAYLAGEMVLKQLREAYKFYERTTIW